MISGALWRWHNLPCEQFENKIDHFKRQLAWVEGRLNPGDGSNTRHLRLPSIGTLSRVRYLMWRHIRTTSLWPIQSQLALIAVLEDDSRSRHTPLLNLCHSSAVKILFDQLLSVPVERAHPREHLCSAAQWESKSHSLLRGRVIPL